ncbi:Zinc finger, CCHC-type [Gossypium australe]|uniref:Zinc finger, CCHC-type n=1 Tax=Gossypium australe TaxID=47621 RepID=A0A5B6VD11_9ROSI|nr:Zinc finger, CCHC-type [Gossypium australe]
MHISFVYESKNPDIQKNTILELKNVSFFENIFPCKTRKVDSSSTKRTSKTIDENKAEHQMYNDVIWSFESTLWKDIIKSEIDSTMQNYTWGINGSSFEK